MLKMEPCLTIPNIDDQSSIGRAPYQTDRIHSASISTSSKAILPKINGSKNESRRQQHKISKKMNEFFQIYGETQKKSWNVDRATRNVMKREQEQ